MDVKMYYSRNKLRLKLVFKRMALACIILTVLMYLLKHSNIPTRWRFARHLLGIRSGSECKERLGPTPADDLLKIRSLRFEGIESYIENFFPPMTRDPDPPELPVFVTALSSDHYDESLYLLNHLKETVRLKYTDLKVIVYGLNLTAQEVKGVTDSCSCEVRIFKFDLYPKHVRRLKSYAFKPLVIQSVAKEHPLVFWLDASVRFKTSNLDSLIADVKRYGVMADYMGLHSTGTIAERTHNATFNFLQESPCVYEYYGELHTGLVLIFANRLITNYFLRPWVSCALTFGCMEPIENASSILTCPVNKIPYKHHLCHRFDQSIFGILYVRLFHQEMKKHAIERDYFMFCRYAAMNSTCEHATSSHSISYLYNIFHKFMNILNIFSA